MPIRPENRARYPADWRAISSAIRERERALREALRELVACKDLKERDHESDWAIRQFPKLRRLAKAQEALAEGRE